MDIPKHVRQNYEIHQWKHPVAILRQNFPKEWSEILTVLSDFKLLKSEIMAAGGQKSPVASRLDRHFYKLGWEEKGFDTKIIVDENELVTPTHQVDCFKNKVAIEVEWNNKDPFYDRDLNNFRLLYDYQAISVGVIITRCDELQEIFNELGKGTSYGQSTTHMRKLLPRLRGSGSAGCPVLIFGITKKLYVEDI